MRAFQQPLDIRISFILRSTYKNEHGKHPIVLRINYRGQRRDLFTGLYCKKENWSSRENRVISSSRDSAVINHHLERIQYKVRERFDEMKFSGEVFTIDELVVKVKGQEEPPQTVLEYSQLKLDEFKDKVGLEIAKTTYYKYRRTHNYLEDFLRDRFQSKNIAVASVNSGFLNQFFKYLRTDKLNSHNSALALMNCLRTILKSAIKSGVIRINPFDDFRVGFKPVDRDFLTKEEVGLLANLTIKSEEIDRSRDIFLIACYTGLAYSDIKQLRRDHIKLDNDGSYYIKKPRQKTSAMSIVPLIEPVIRILLKYSPTGDPRDFVIHVPCNQILNRNLKTIAKEAKIHKHIFMHLGRHTFATSVTLSNGVPLETVSKMLGHTSLKHTVRYARVVQEKIKADMGKVREIFK